MPDRETVAKGLDIILHGCDEQCSDCCFGFKEPGKPSRCKLDEEQIQEAALALLKEQEAVEARKKCDGKPQLWSSWWYVCGGCGQDIDYHDRYCRGCGKAVKWE